MTRRSFLPLFLVLLLGAGAAAATTLARMNLDELAAAAHVVVRARCLGNETRWERGEIWTFTSFEVIETLKGAVPRLLTVQLLGGQMEHLISTVDGVPRFRAGEEVILFLERTPANDFCVTSWAQGTFRIRRDAHTGQERVTQDSSRLAVYDPAAREFQTKGVRDLPIEVFRQRVAAALERQQSGRQR